MGLGLIRAIPELRSSFRLEGFAAADLIGARR
jgi:hypothetical protein